MYIWWTDEPNESNPQRFCPFWHLCSPSLEPHSSHELRLRQSKHDRRSWFSPASVSKILAKRSVTINFFIIARSTALLSNLFVLWLYSVTLLCFAEYRSRLSQWSRIKKRRECEVDKATQNLTKNYPMRTRTELIYIRVDAKKSD